jgi:hypothetical protein
MNKVINIFMMIDMFIFGFNNLFINKMNKNNLKF